jgi:glycosyltransferase involved in cell wall biosynthesis
MTEVLYLSYDGMTDPLGQSQVLPYLVGLSEKGYRITLVSFEKPDRFQVEEKTIKAFCNINGIDWRPLMYTKRPPVFSTIYDVLKLKKAAFRIKKEKNIQLVHCRSYITMLIGLSLKKSGVRLLFDMRGFWADERIEGKIWNLKNPLFRLIYRYFKNKERAFLNESDAIVSLTHAGKNELLSWDLENVTSQKITVIPCCVNEHLFSPLTINQFDKSALLQKMQLSPYFVVGYIGSIGTWYQLEEMLFAFKKIKEEKTNALFLFVTKEPRQTILNAAKKMGVKKDAIQVIAASHPEVPLYISLFDVAIFFITPSFSKKASSPTKQGEIMSMGIPLICNAGVGDTDMVVEKYSAGQIVPSTLLDDLEHFKLDLSRFDKAKTQQGATEFYGLNTGIDRYNTIYKQILQ